PQAGRLAGALRVRWQERQGRNSELHARRQDREPALHQSLADRYVEGRRGNRQVQARSAVGKESPMTFDNRKVSALVVAAVFLLTGATGRAHHEITAKFDPTKPITVTGVVTLLDWRDPHAHIFINVKSTCGASTTTSTRATASNSAQTAAPATAGR